MENSVDYYVNTVDNVTETVDNAECDRKCDVVVEINDIISGVGKDEPTEVNEFGGKQSRLDYRFDLIDPKALFAVAKVLKDGHDKYGSDQNWRVIPIRDHLNHLLAHTYAYLAGDRQDDHLSHAVCRALFALAVEIEKGA